MNDISSELEKLGNMRSVQYTTDECEAHMTPITQPFSILYVNIRSINKNFDQLQVFLRLIHVFCDIIVLTECWLSKISSIPILRGYTSHFTRSVAK